MLGQGVVEGGLLPALGACLRALVHGRGWCGLVQRGCGVITQGLPAATDTAAHETAGEAATAFPVGAGCGAGEGIAGEGLGAEVVGGR